MTEMEKLEKIIDKEADKIFSGTNTTIEPALTMHVFAGPIEKELAGIRKELHTLNEILKRRK